MDKQVEYRIEWQLADGRHRSEEFKYPKALETFIQCLNKRGSALHNLSTIRVYKREIGPWEPMKD